MQFKRNLIASLAIASLLFINPAAADSARINPMDTIVVTAATTLGADKISREQATKANNAAAEHAVDAVLAATKLDLDIRLIGPTSVRIASDR